MTMTSTAQLRKIKKPVIERRRRERINECLQQLKTIILEAEQKEPSRYSKMEKADILEMTVRHLKSVHSVMRATSSPRSPCTTPCSPVEARQYIPHDVTLVRQGDNTLDRLSPAASSVGLGDIVGQTEPLLGDASQKYSDSSNPCAMEVDKFVTIKHMKDVPAYEHKGIQAPVKPLNRHTAIEQSHDLCVRGQVNASDKQLATSIKYGGYELKVRTVDKNTEILNANTSSIPFVGGRTTSQGFYPTPTSSTYHISSTSASGNSMKSSDQCPPILAYTASTSSERFLLPNDVQTFSTNIFSTNTVVSPALFTIVSDSTFMNDLSGQTSPRRNGVIPLYATVPVGCPVNIVPVAALNRYSEINNNNTNNNNQSEACCPSGQVQPLMSSYNETSHFNPHIPSPTPVTRCRSPPVADEFPRSINRPCNNSSPARTTPSFYNNAQDLNCRQLSFINIGGHPTTATVNNNSSSTKETDMWRPWSFGISRS